MSPSSGTFKAWRQMTHAQSIIEKPILLITLFLSAFRLTIKMTLYHLTSYNVCSQWFENHKFVLQCFHFFYYRVFLSLWKENPERQMTLHLLILLTTANTNRYSILLAPFDVQHTDTTKPTKWITVRHKCTDCFFDWLLHHWAFLQFISTFFLRLKSILFVLFVARWLPVMSTL